MPRGKQNRRDDSSQSGGGIAPVRGVSKRLGGLSSRTFLPLVIFIVIAVVIILPRLFDLQVIKAGEYSAMAQEARIDDSETVARRGTIYDVNGNVLAITMDARIVAANLPDVKDIDKLANACAEVLGGEAQDYKEKLSQPNVSYVWLKRFVDVETAEKLEAMNLDGIRFEKDFRREYPYGQTGGQIIGFLGADGEAKCGLELYYDDILRGTPGVAIVERDRSGSPIPGGVHEVTPAMDGQDIMISIDIDVQAMLEEKLVDTKHSMGATSMSSVIADADSGAIVAMASLPLFNPSDPSSSDVGSDTVAPVSLAFEPGSMFKTVAAMAILESGTMKPDDTIYCPPEIQANEYWVSDAHDRGGETMSLRDIIDRSSNVGISLATERMGFQEFYDKINAYHMNEATGIDFPGEAEGYMVDFENWSKIQGYSATFGQGLSVTALQLVRFYSGIANDGFEPTPHLLIQNLTTGEKPEYEPEEVIENKEAVATMTDMLRTVVTNGTGTLADIPGYKVCGKTSTAEIAAETGGYRTDAYNLGFCGFLDGASTQLVCFVGANEVQYEGTVTPVFRDIMGYTIDHYRISPE